MLKLGCEDNSRPSIRQKIHKNNYQILILYSGLGQLKMTFFLFYTSYDVKTLWFHLIK